MPAINDAIHIVQSHVNGHENGTLQNSKADFEQLINAHVIFDIHQIFVSSVYRMRTMTVQQISQKKGGE